MGPPPLDLLPHLLRGAAVTLEITLATAVLAFVLSFVVAAARASAIKPIRWLAVAYVEVLRGTSAIVQLFYLFFILPAFGVSLPAMATAIVGLTLNMSAYGSEIVRAGLDSVGEGQREAAKALGLSPFKVYRLVVIPQALGVMLPSFGNLLIELIKATSLVSLITLTELTFSGRQMVVSTGRSLEVWGLVLLLYFALSYPLTWVVRYAEKRATRFR